MRQVKSKRQTMMVAMMIMMSYELCHHVLSQSIFNIPVHCSHSHISCKMVWSWSSSLHAVGSVSTHCTERKKSNLQSHATMKYIKKKKKCYFIILLNFIKLEANDYICLKQFIITHGKMK